MIDDIVVDVLLVCTKTLLDLPAFSEGNPSVTDSPHNEPEMQSFDLPFVISLDKLLNELSSRR